MSDVDMIESLALRLVQGMEELGVNWWCFNGWSFRRLSQEDLTFHGRGSEDHEQEPEPGSGAPPALEAGDNGGDTGRGPVVRATKLARRAFAEAKATRTRRRLAKGPRRRLSRRGWR